MGLAGVVPRVSDWSLDSPNPKRLKAQITIADLYRASQSVTHKITRRHWGRALAPTATRWAAALRARSSLTKTAPEENIPMRAYWNQNSLTPSMCIGAVALKVTCLDNHFRFWKHSYAIKVENILHNKALDSKFLTRLTRVCVKHRVIRIYAC